jgi:predicted histone-like DNA-binding protein
MEINYEIGTINNVSGEGGKHQFVSLDLQPALTNKQLEKRIEQSTTLTRADIRAVLSELRYIIEQSLIAGRRFHLDGIGYLSLSAGMYLPEDNKKITGKNIFLRGINFLPERELLTAVRGNVTFRHSKTTSRSTIYKEEELWQKVEVYLSENRYITVRNMREQFGLTYYTATKWLSTFVAEGRLVKDGTRHEAMYFSAE